jgi:hypothetical protein
MKAYATAMPSLTPEAEQERLTAVDEQAEDFTKAGAY